MPDQPSATARCRRCSEQATFRVSVLGGKKPPIRGVYCGLCVEWFCDHYPDRTVAASPLAVSDAN